MKSDVFDHENFTLEWHDIIICVLVILFELYSHDSGFYSGSEESGSSALT